MIFSSSSLSFNSWLVPSVDELGDLPEHGYTDDADHAEYEYYGDYLTYDGETEEDSSSNIRTPEEHFDKEYEEPEDDLTERNVENIIDPR